MLRIPALVAVLGVAVLAVALPSTSNGQSTSRAIAGCTVATNVAMIIDDSGSMAFTDPKKLRVAGAKLLLEKSANEKKTFSALQFGGGLSVVGTPDASAVFAPGIVGQQKGAMEAALDAQIDANDGATNYNAAFALRKTQNPNANRIIFMTDGGHNIGAYDNASHQGGPPVDVLGFSSGITTPDQARLQQIASDTKGTYHALADSADLQAVMNEVDATENCLGTLKRFDDQFIKVGQTVSHTLNISNSTKSVDVTMTWGDSGNNFGLAGVTLVNHGQVIAKGQTSRRRKPRKLKIRKSESPTFKTYHISRLKKGKLKFKLRANTLATPGTQVKLTTQLSGSNH